MLLRSGNRLVIDSTSQEIFDLVAPQLIFTETEYLRGYEAVMARKNHESLFRNTMWECYGTDIKGRLACAYGYWKRIKDTLTVAGYRVVMKDLTPHPPLRRRSGRTGSGSTTTVLRPGQEEFLRKVLSQRCGRFDCPPGYGKSFLIGLAAVVLPFASNRRHRQSEYQFFVTASIRSCAGCYLRWVSSAAESGRSDGG